MIYKQVIFIFLLFIFFAFQINGEHSCQEVQLYTKADFPIGVAVNIDKLKNDRNYRAIVLAQFNSITAELRMKPVFVHPAKETFDFGETDYLIEFCRTNNKRLHGHTLVWHRRLPLWMENFQGNRAAWEAMLKQHIQTIVTHCKGQIKSWDVVNEAFNDDGSLRDNVWLKNIGESYIEKSFAYAAEADSSAKFFYNDYNLESNRKKLQAVMQFITKLRSQGVRIDGVGMQMHIGDKLPDIHDINQSALLIQEQGMLVHYSELDISLNKDDEALTLTNDMLEHQKNRMKEVVKGYLKLQKNIRFGITIWGVMDTEVSADKHQEWPTLYDSDYKIKPAYCGFVEELTE